MGYLCAILSIGELVASIDGLVYQSSKIELGVVLNKFSKWREEINRSDKSGSTLNHVVRSNYVVKESINYVQFI